MQLSEMHGAGELKTVKYLKMYIFWISLQENTGSNLGLKTNDCVDFI